LQQLIAEIVPSTMAMSDWVALVLPSFQRALTIPVAASAAEVPVSASRKIVRPIAAACMRNLL
jgi:hypothetical protein